MGTRSVLQYRSPTRRCSRALPLYACDWHGALQRLAALVHSCAFASAARHAACARLHARCSVRWRCRCNTRRRCSLTRTPCAFRPVHGSGRRSWCPSRCAAKTQRTRRSAWRAQCGAQHAWTGRTIISYRHSATRGAARSAQQLGMRRENPLRRVSYSAHSGVCAEQCTAAQRRFCNVWCTYDVCIACRHPHVGMTGNSATLCTRTRAASAIKRS